MGRWGWAGVRQRSKPNCKTKLPSLVAKVNRALSGPQEEDVVAHEAAESAVHSAGCDPVLPIAETQSRNGSVSQVCECVSDEESVYE